MICDYSKLIGKIAEYYKTRRAFSKAMEISEKSLSVKLNNKASFSQDEIERACVLLHIADFEIPLYFFTRKVQ